MGRWRERILVVRTRSTAGRRRNRGACPESRLENPDLQQTAQPSSEARRLAAAMRSVIEHLYTTKAPDSDLRRAADGLELFAASLARLPRRTKLEGYAESANSGDVDAFFDYSPFIGLSNPLSPPIRLKVENERV